MLASIDVNKESITAISLAEKINHKAESIGDIKRLSRTEKKAIKAPFLSLLKEDRVQSKNKSSRYLAFVLILTPLLLVAVCFGFVFFSRFKVS